MTHQLSGPERSPGEPPQRERGGVWWHKVSVVRRATPVLALAVGAAIALSGCGGSDDEDAGGTTTVPAGTTTAAAENQRLSSASWSEYVTARDQAQAVNQKAITTFSKCSDLLARNVGSEQIQQCFGTTTTDVVTEGQEFLTTLEGFEDEVGGACAKALTDYAGNVKLYISSVNALTSGDTPSPAPAQVDEASGALVRARASGTAFEAACKPA